MAEIINTELYSENRTSTLHKRVCEAQIPRYLKHVVMCSAFCSLIPVFCNRVWLL